MTAIRGTVVGTACAAGAASVVGLAVAASSRLTGYPVAEAQAMRYAAAAVVLGLLTWRAGHLRRLRGLGIKEWGMLAALAASGLVVFNLAVMGSVGRIDPSLTGAIVGCAPIALALLGPPLTGRRPRAVTVAAAVVVAAGAALVEAATPHATAAGVGLALAAVAGETGFSLLAVPLLPRLDPIALSFAITVLATAMLAAIAPLLPGPPLRPPTAEEAAAIAFLALPVTVGGFLGWYVGLQRLGTDRAAPLLGLIPVTAMLGSVLVGTSPLAAAKALGAALVAVGVVAGLSRRAATAERSSGPASPPRPADPAPVGAAVPPD